ncbi:hypothetical protein [Hymenobacter persicinus]|uniref:SGNH/GDSL hydrolase family protein n=1 Tax=Hymenobacter persicinus TaxID=2025506 RepID=A0A4Q5LBX7_9BACT|nr:hypothetical protein [Hymenobacter persicinus]RYU79948.1 hypothetical protein EWM57_09710 [Hymenobacter persicinus]
MRLSFSSAAARVAFAALAGSLALTSCSPEQTAPAPNAGPLDFSKHVAVGDNYIAGYSDGGLTLAGQQYSLGLLLDQQFAMAAGSPSSFTQPLMPAGTGSGYLKLRELTPAGLLLTSRVTAGRMTQGSYINPNACGGPDTAFVYPRATNVVPRNLGVPFIRLTQIDSVGLGNAANLRKPNFNPFLERLLPAGDNRSYLQLVTDGTANATFFTFSMGLGDVLPYLLAGGECNSALPNTAAINLMKANVKKILDKVTDNGKRRGIICLAPYSMNQLPILDRGSITRAQALVQATDTIYVRGSIPANVVRPMAAKDDYILPSGLAQLGKAQTITLPGGGTASVRYGVDKRNPLSRRDVLDLNEYSRVNQAITTINDEIVRLADAVYKVPVINRSVGGINVFDQVSKRISVNGVEYSPEPVRGNFYSLDQYTLAPRGTAIMANAMIREINRFYGASIPQLDPNTLPTDSQR